MNDPLQPTLFHSFGAALLRWPRWAAWLLTGAWYAGIGALSSRPGSAEPSHWSMHVLSNSAHAPLFGILAACIALLLPREHGWPRIDARARWIIACVVAVAGICDELHQSLVPGRDLSVLDVGTDVAGACAALEIVAALGREHARLAPRFVVAACVSFAAGAIATFVPRCFPTVTWF